MKGVGNRQNIHLLEEHVEPTSETHYCVDYRQRYIHNLRIDVFANVGNHTNECQRSIGQSGNHVVSQRFDVLIEGRNESIEIARRLALQTDKEKTE